MSSLITLFVIVFLAAFVFQANAFSQDKADKIDELMKIYHEYGQFNGSVLVSEGGKVIFKRGYGLAQMEWNIPNKPNTKFRIGSVTKQFTSMLILPQIKRQGEADRPWWRDQRF